MKNVDMPKIGFRNIKTGIAVFICLIILNLIGTDNYTLSCIATIICMGDTLENTIKISRNRLYGILIGGFSSIIFLYTIDIISNENINTPIVVAIGVSFIIYICTLLKSTASCTVACVMYISIMFGYSGSGALKYVLNNAFYTFIGVVVSITVNSLIKPPTPRNEVIDELISLTLAKDEDIKKEDGKIA